MSEKRLNNTIFLMYLAAEEADESVENSTTDTDGMLPSVEDYSALRADEISESIREIRRKAESNGGYVTYEELNRMLPHGIVDAIQSDRKMAQKPISLQARLGDDGDATVGDLIPDAGSVKPFEATESHLLREPLQMVLGTLSGREREATIRNGCGSNRLCENARRIRHLRGRVGFMGCALFGHT